MKSKTLKKKASLNRSSAQKSISEAVSNVYRFSKRHSAYAFVASLGVWLPKAQAATQINLDATGLGALVGTPLATWTNTGATIGDFVSSGASVPNVTNVDGVVCVQIAAGGVNHYLGPVAPVSVCTNNPRTVEAWIWDPNAQAGKTIFAWGQRNLDFQGIADGRNEVLEHGTDPGFGAMSQWGAPDLGYGSSKDVVIGAWTYLAYTFDGTKDFIYVDGTVRNGESPAAVSTSRVGVDGTTPLKFRIARQTAGGSLDGTAISGADLGPFYAARIRVKDGVVMTAADILAQYNAEKGSMGYGDTDGDGMPDWWEARNGLNPNDATGANGAAGDPDGDGLSNLQEYLHNSNPQVADTDGDGINDLAEVNRVNPITLLAEPTDPSKADTDGDGLSDAVETGLAGSTNPTKGDTDGDSYSDGDEVAKGTDPLNAASHPNAIIALDATGLPLGGLPTWLNGGTLPGNFGALSPTNPPTVWARDGVNGVHFTTIGGGGTNGTSYFGPTVPVGLTGAGARSVDMWVWNPTRQDEKTMFAWGARAYTPNTGANVSFGEGQNGGYGAVAQWGTPDIGWANQDVYGRWTHLAYTYDGTTTRIYADGVLVDSEAFALITAVNGLTDGQPYHFRIARQNGNSTTNSIDATGFGDFTMAKLRVHDFAENGASIKARYDLEKAAFGQVDTDGDGLPDWYEIRCGLNPNDATGVNGASGDKDGDGLTNLQEYQLGQKTYPLGLPTAQFPGGTRADLADTDADGLNDAAEVNRIDPQTTLPAATNPLNADTDGDGLKDGVETDTGLPNTGPVNPLNTGSDPLKVDSDGDGFNDGLEVAQGSNPNNPAEVPNPNAIINLDATATNFPAGPLTVWTNSGTLAGNFTAELGGAVAGPVQGVNALTFDGGGYVGPAATFVTGNPNYSVEAWVYNPTIGDEETVIGWGRRGGPDGTMSAFTYGNDGTWGAMTHWGAPDLSWNGHLDTTHFDHIVYTYDAATLTQICYMNGAEANREVLGGALAIVDSLDGGVTHLPFRVANETAGDGSAANGFAGRMSIGEIRVYTRVLPPSEITTKYTTGAAKYGINDTDGDGMPDWYERTHGFDLNNPADGALDPDGDGLSNAEEYANKSDPFNADTDGDGIPDGEEVHPTIRPFPTSPIDRDTDRDGLDDNVETGTGVYVSPQNTGTTANFPDSDGDGVADAIEVAYRIADGVTDPNSAGSVPDTTVPVPVIKLDATALATGPLSTWTNLSGLPNWNFVTTTNPAASVQYVDGTKGVTLNLTNNYVGHGAPVYMAGNASRTVDAWIYNPTAAGEETVFAWGRRGGGPDGSNSAFSHGTDAGFGALQFWGGGPDVPWGTSAGAIASNVVTSKWTYVTYTYDNVTGIRACYKDGVLANSETNDVGVVLSTFATNSPAGNALSFRVGAQNEADGSMSAAAQPSMTIAKLRVYDLALTAGQIATTYNAERVQFPGQPKITNVKVNPANGFVSFDWVPAPGKTYAVERNSDVSNPNGWSTIATGQTAGSFTNNPAGAPINHYRLRIE